MGNRRKSREFALQILYQLDVNPGDITQALDSFWKDEKADSDTQAFSGLLVIGTFQKKDEIDQMIQPILKNWKIERLTAIDHIVLRMGVFEMIFFPKDNKTHEHIPFAVTINEAVDIAKKYSSPESGKFVNGILDQIRKDFSKGERN